MPFASFSNGMVIGSADNVDWGNYTSDGSEAWRTQLDADSSSDSMIAVGDGVVAVSRQDSLVAAGMQRAESKFGHRDSVN